MANAPQELHVGQVLLGSTPRWIEDGYIHFPPAAGPRESEYVLPQAATMHTYPGAYPFQPEEEVTIPAGTRIRWRPGDARTRTRVVIVALAAPHQAEVLVKTPEGEERQNFAISLDGILQAVEYRAGNVRRNLMLVVGERIRAFLTFSEFIGWTARTEAERRERAAHLLTVFRHRVAEAI